MPASVTGNPLPESVTEPPLRVAIAGCHRMLTRPVAGHNWAAACAVTPGVAIAAVYDKGEATRQAFLDCWGPLPAFDDYTAMLAATRPDIVCVATRQTQHADQIAQAIAAGARGILCEKPLATSMEETDRIVGACRAAGVAFAFGLDRRWFPYYQALARDLREGIVGAVRSIAAFGLPNFINHGCHWFDRVLELAGDPEVAWVSGAVEALDNLSPEAPKRLDPTGSCQIQFANGVEAFVSAAGSGLGFDIVGDRGRLAIASDGADTRLWRVGADGKSVSPREWPPVVSAPAGPAAVSDLARAVWSGAPTRAPIAVARRATEIGFAAHQSHLAGGRRVAPAEIERGLRIASFAWGNE